MRKKVFIGLSGEPGSGKDTVAKIIKEEFGAKVLTSSYLLKRSLSIFLDEFSRKDMIWYVKELTKQFGEDIISKAMIKSMKRFKREMVVFNGVRLPSDCEYLKKEKARLIYITADPRLRWKRIRIRNEKTDDNASWEKFMQMHYEKTEISVPKIGEKADYVIENNGTREDLKNKVVEVIEKIKKQSL
ncbi:MAG: AAA family ATPase [Patescibacteria group bacterium]|nr:AAA family ATPase [Patescibacteria group bacterium]